MKELDRKLYELLADKTLSFGCVVEVGYNVPKESGGVTGIESMGIYTGVEDFSNMPHRIIGHEPTIADLHRWLNVNIPDWRQDAESIWWTGYLETSERYETVSMEYFSSQSLLSQSDETKQSIIELITSTK